MRGKSIGYVRVSTFEQNHKRQLEGVVLSKCFVEKASRKDTNRPQLMALLDYVREGDKVIVHSMDRLARNLDDLRRLVQQLTTQRVTIKFVKEGLTFTGDDSPMSELLLSMVGAFSQFERSLIKERQMEGIALAKGRGVYKGRKPKLSVAQAREMKLRIAQGDIKSKVARAFGISRETLYKYLRECA